MSDLFDTVLVSPTPKTRYPVYIGAGSLSRIGELIRRHTRAANVFIITHPELTPLFVHTVREACKAQGLKTCLIEFPSGESHKNLATASHILDQILAHRPERTDVIVGIGGGVVGDVSGMVASLILRGLDIIHVPTTLLSQTDSAIGGKTGVNHQLGKNLVGTFYQPRCVVIDPETLYSLDAREVQCGLAEIIKYGIIRDKVLFRYMETMTRVLAAHQVTPENRNVWETLILHSVKNKAYVVTRDEREAGLREILNFGHTIGHAIEAEFQYATYSHGEAVAMGMAAVIMLAHRMKLLTKPVARRMLNLLNALGFSAGLPLMDPDSLIQRLYHDKKVRQSKVRFIVPLALGKVDVRNDITDAMVHRILNFMMKQEGAYADSSDTWSEFESVGAAGA